VRWPVAMGTNFTARVQVALAARVVQQLSVSVKTPCMLNPPNCRVLAPASGQTITLSATVTSASASRRRRHSGHGRLLWRIYAAGFVAACRECRDVERRAAAAGPERDDRRVFGERRLRRLDIRRLVRCGGAVDHDGDALRQPNHPTLRQPDYANGPGKLGGDRRGGRPGHLFPTPPS
jgi:hypothetical protein